MTKEQQDAIRDRVDARVTTAVLEIVADEEAKHPDALISVPRSVTVQQKRPEKSTVGHKGTTRPVTKAETEAVAASTNGSRRK